MLSAAVSRHAAMAALCLGLPAAAAAQTTPQYWLPSYAAPPTEAFAGTDYGGFSLRQSLHTSLGGSQVRLRISNLYGAVPLVIGTAAIATPTGLDTIAPASAVTFTFGGKPGVTMSDRRGRGQRRGDVRGGTQHRLPGHDLHAAIHRGRRHIIRLPAISTTSPWATRTSAATMPRESTGSGVVFLSGLDVAQAAPTPAIVAFGDSITDGFGQHVWHR